MDRVMGIIPDLFLCDNLWEKHQNDLLSFKAGVESGRRGLCVTTDVKMGEVVIVRKPTESVYSANVFAATNGEVKEMLDKLDDRHRLRLIMATTLLI